MSAKANRQRTKGVRTVLRWLASLMLLISLHAFAQSTNSVTYVYTDPQGTPLAEADASGNITATFEYTPYGTFAPTGTSNPGPDPKGPGYTGHVNDPETNLVYMQARYYDSATGHFLSIDPAPLEAGDTSSFNRYSYVNNNPIAGIDPTGKFDDNLTGSQISCEVYAHSGCNTSGSRGGKSTGSSTPMPSSSHTSGWQWFLIGATNALCAGGVQGACDEGPANAEPLTPGGEQDQSWSTAGSLVGQAALIPLFGPEEEAATPGATRVSFKGRFTKIGASQIYVDMSMNEAIKNLSASGYIRSVSQDGKVVVMSNGSQTYTFYQKSTGGGIKGGATGFPSASLQVVGARSPITKLRFTSP